MKPPILAAEFEARTIAPVDTGDVAEQTLELLRAAGEAEIPAAPTRFAVEENTRFLGRDEG